jgi:hypothetical protein
MFAPESWLWISQAIKMRYMLWTGAQMGNESVVAGEIRRLGSGGIRGKDMI